MGGKLLWRSYTFTWLHVVYREYIISTHKAFLPLSLYSSIDLLFGEIRIHMF